MTDHAHAHAHHGAAMASGDMAKDPVCGMMVSKAGAVASGQTFEHDANMHYFCSRKCVTKFQSDPARYVSGAHAPAENAAAGSEYTCPMHPEVRQTGPGNCPICGMEIRRMTTEEIVDVAIQFSKNNKAGKNILVLAHIFLFYTINREVI